MLGHPSVYCWLLDVFGSLFNVSSLPLMFPLGFWGLFLAYFHSDCLDWMKVGFDLTVMLLVWVWVREWDRFVLPSLGASWSSAFCFVGRHSFREQMLQTNHPCEALRSKSLEGSLRLGRAIFVTALRLKYWCPLSIAAGASSIEIMTGGLIQQTQRIWRFVISWYQSGHRRSIFFLHAPETLIF